MLNFATIFVALGPGNQTALLDLAAPVIPKTAATTGKHGAIVSLPKSRFQRPI